MTVPCEKDLDIEKVVELLFRAKDSLKTCLDYECQEQQYSIASLLLHVMHCIEDALMAFDKRYYEHRQEIRSSYQASKRLVERGQ